MVNMYTVTNTTIFLIVCLHY